MSDIIPAGAGKTGFAGETTETTETTETQGSGRYYLEVQTWLQSEKRYPISKATYDWQLAKSKGEAPTDLPPTDPLVDELLSEFTGTLTQMKESLTSMLVSGAGGELGMAQLDDLADVFVCRKGGHGGGSEIHLIHGWLRAQTEDEHEATVASHATTRTSEVARQTNHSAVGGPAISKGWSPYFDKS